MPNQQLIDYITQSAAQGTGKEEIKSALLGAGWQEADVNEGLLAVFPISAQKSAVGGKSKALIATVSALAVLLLAGGGFAYWYFVYEPKQQVVAPQEQQVSVPRGLTPQEDALIPKLYAVMVSNGASLGTTLPGSSFDFKFKVTNTGDSEDVYKLSFTSTNPKWAVSHQIPPSVILKPQEQSIFKIEVEVPSDAKPCDGSKITLIAYSNYMPGLLDEGNMEITVRGKNISWSSFDCPGN